MFRKIILSILMLSSLFSSILLAVGLGDYKLNSRLNQPLSAEIDLLFTDDYAIHELNAVLASQSEFDKVGVDRIFFLNDLRFKTVKGKNGKLVLKLTTRREVKEPFLNFLVELNWPNGRMIREYTFLLDPPLYDSSTSSTIQKTQTTYSPVYQTEKKNRPNPAPKKAQDFSFTGSTYGPVKENDTLWSIATKARPNSRVSIQQTLVAIFRANPDAFAEGNINNLLKGKVLQIPDAETVASVPHRAALQDVVMQNKQWRSGGARKIVGNSNNTSSSSNASKGGRLTLATPDSSGGGGASGSGTSDEELAVIEARLARSQEKTQSLEAENNQLKESLQAALNQLKELKTDDSPLNVTDSELAVLTKLPEQDVLEEDSKIDETLDSSEDKNVVDSEAIQPQDEQKVADTQQSDSASESSTPESATTETGTTEEDKSASTSESSFKQPDFLKKKEKDWVEELTGYVTDYWQYLSGLAVLILILVFLKMRKKMGDDEFKDDLMNNSGALSATESFDMPNIDGDDMLNDIGIDGASSEFDQDQGDPLSEADIYISHQKFDQAESILLSAIEQNSIRSDLKVKLMECYAGMGDQEKFESLAQEVSQAIDANDWMAQVNHLRDNVWGSTNDDSFDLPSSDDIFNSDDFNFDDSDSGDASIDITTDSTEDFSTDALDLNTNDDADDTFDLDMNFDLNDDAANAETETFSLDDAPITDDSIEEFSLDDVMSDSAPEAVTQVESTNILPDDDISLDLDDDFSFDDDEISFDEDASGADEIATKLDLARAYIDMGDAEGAKEILEEVLAEGNDEQKREAQTLLNK